MSLALWEMFWTEADWVPGPPPPPPPAPAAPDSITDSGGGGQGRSDDDTFPPEDFWDVREAYLRSLFEKVRQLQPEKPVPPPPADDYPEDSPQKRLESFFPRYTAELGEAVNALRLAESAAELKKQGTRIAELMAGYQAAKRAVEEDNARREIDYRVRQAERLAKKQAAIAAAELLLRAIKGR